ncbi:MAG: PRC-barrel domain containing protein [Halomonadaceae bacterium]|nr:MAG: PRC-barrel domain containing protein [Halomonadaceae bacterium]
MKKMTSLVMAVALVPVMAMGVATVSAEEDRQAMGQQQESGFITSKPQGSLSADDLIGNDVRNRQTDEDIGNISDLIIDEDGRISAVVVGTGAFMGMGGADVAISWDRVEQVRDGEDDVSLYVDMTQEELEQAPEYDNEEGGMFD